MRRSSGVAVAAVLLVLGAAPPVGAVLPRAGTSYTVTACDPNTTRPGSPQQVQVDPAWLEGGRMVAVMNNPGTVNPGLGAPPPTPGIFYGTPLCVVGPLVNGVPQAARWVFCLNHPLAACGEAPFVRGGTEGAKEPLTALQRARVAHLLSPGVADYSTSSTRGLMAQRIWCVTENLPAGAPLPDPDRYPGVTCPDWGTIDPTLPAEPALTLTAGPDAEAGAEIPFELTSTAGRVRVTATGTDGLTLCQGAPGTLTDGLLELPAGTTATRLCARRADGGSGAVRVEGAETVTDPQFLIPTETPERCQGYVDTVGSRRTLTASGTANWRPATTPPVVQAPLPSMAPVPPGAAAPAPPRTPEVQASPGGPQTPAAPETLAAPPSEPARPAHPPAPLPPAEAWTPTPELRVIEGSLPETGTGEAPVLLTVAGGLSALGGLLLAGARRPRR
ncbi:LPXTG cell wall anchor domain-containing protein [Kitasatospora albolonga]|uniref:LPXTG cell wall anchor domain-containing protein n=1 Tax=Kitasatospora albolonga TaxID=68173 RepID=UPI0031E803C8